MTTPVKLLKKHGIRPVKRLGQSFLIDTNIINKIVSSAALEKNEIVVEIGAGIGYMTVMLAGAAGRVVAVDVDPKMVEVLETELEGFGNVTIIQEDILKYDFASAVKDYPESCIKVVGNVPYNISSPIFFRLIEYRKMISSMVLMFQKEVAERFAAPPGTKQYGILAVMANFYSEVKKVVNVPASCFSPKPKIESMVVKMDMREKPLYEVEDEDLFFRLVKASMARRRKTLLNNLRASELFVSREIEAKALLSSLDIDDSRRGETLTVEEFARISNALYFVQRS